MVQEFIDSWPLFANTYLAGWAIAVLLSCVGWMVIARDQIFIGAAVSQASTLGIAVALFLSSALTGHDFSWINTGWFTAAMAVCFSIAAALLTNFGGQTGRLSREAITGWVFLVSSSFAVVLLYHTPIGMKEIQERLSSSIIGADQGEIIFYVCLSLITIAGMMFTRRAWILLAMDPPMAEAVGLRLWRWELSWSLWLGLIVGLSIRSGGTLYTFGCLVLPPLVANQVCKEVSKLIIVSPLIGLVFSIVGFMVANYYDLPPAQITIALLSTLLLIVWLGRRMVAF